MSSLQKWSTYSKVQNNAKTFKSELTSNILIELTAMILADTTKMIHVFEGTDQRENLQKRAHIEHTYRTYCYDLADSFEYSE